MLYEVITDRRRLADPRRPDQGDHASLSRTQTDRSRGLEVSLQLKLKTSAQGRQIVEFVGGDTLEKVVVAHKKTGEVTDRITSYNVCYTKLLRSVATNEKLS